VTMAWLQLLPHIMQLRPRETVMSDGWFLEIEVSNPKKALCCGVYMCDGLNLFGLACNGQGLGKYTRANCWAMEDDG